MSLEVGDKYLSVKIVGHDYVVAFPNKKVKETEPDFKGDGVAVWVKKKQAPKRMKEELI